jgi:hypothetical protein
MHHEWCATFRNGFGTKAMFAELINSTIANLAQSMIPGDQRHALLIHRLEAVRDERCSDAHRCRSCPLHPAGDLAPSIARAGQGHPKSDQLVIAATILDAGDVTVSLSTGAAPSPVAAPGP